MRAGERLPLFSMSGKAPALQPQLDSSSGNVELSNIAQVDGGASGERDIMQLARLGDIPGIQRLFDENKFIPSYCDEEGITPLHVGHINSSGDTSKLMPVLSGLL
jgi:palmitoyltransferase